ncbi:MAG: Gx transporter family protein, partial [Oscillospiraceae bacterium]|nr:Gx transporter family protein [Oscillospiraceae bacterium]
MRGSRSPAARLAEGGILVALAFALAYIERWIPAAPVPGLKLGLANIVTLIALDRLGVRASAGVVAARCVLAAILFGQTGSLAFSLTGGLLALAAMAILRTRPALSVYGVSVAGAAAHNLGQTMAAAVVLGTPAVFGYLVYLLPLSVP